MIKQLEEFLKSDHWLQRYCIFSGEVFYFEPPYIYSRSILSLCFVWSSLCQQPTFSNTENFQKFIFKLLQTSGNFPNLQPYIELREISDCRCSLCNWIHLFHYVTIHHLSLSQHRNPFHYCRNPSQHRLSRTSFMQLHATSSPLGFQQQGRRCFLLHESFDMAICVHTLQTGESGFCIGSLSAKTQ